MSDGPSKASECRKKFQWTNITYLDINFSKL